MKEFEERILATIYRFQMVTPGEAVLVAVSGGVDSMTLLHVLRRLPLNLRLAVFHLNHGLRPESADEAKMVSRICEGWSLPCLIKEIDGERLRRAGSLEAVARGERYRLLAKVAQEMGVDRIALGHHADDQVETMVMRFLSGAGPQGMAGIPPVRGRYIRPLFEVSREEILDYAGKAGLKWAEDSSNQGIDFLRNRIRHSLLPYLIREYQPQLKERLQEAARIFREWEELLMATTERILEEWEGAATNSNPSLPVDRWLAFSPAIRRAVFRELYFRIAPSGARLEFKHSEAFLRLLEGENGKRIQLPGRVEAIKERDRITIKQREEIKKTSYLLPLALPGRTMLPQEKGWVDAGFPEVDALSLDWEKVASNEAYLDPERFQPPFYLRSRKPGDRFSPLGLMGSKKIKDYFGDCKVPRDLRDEVPILVDSEERILWVVGYRPDERGRITKQTKRVLYLRYCQKNPDQ